MKRMSDDACFVNDVLCSRVAKREFYQRYTYDKRSAVSLFHRAKNQYVEAWPKGDTGRGIIITEGKTWFRGCDNRIIEIRK